MTNYKPITSSNLAGANYNHALRLLYVKFKNGTRYCYYNFPAELYAEFEKTFSGENGLSAGRFFNEHIKSLPCEKVGE